MNHVSSSIRTVIVTRFAIAAAIIVACLLLIVSTAKIAFSKIAGRYALMTNSIFVANEAVRLAPSDPQAHQARAIVLYNLRLPADAAKEMEIAVSLRPEDDYLWLELGGLREATNSSDAALAAFDRAVALAPYYGHTHWQRGNLLVRMQRFDEGFKELRTAVSSNRDFLPGLIDLAWGVSRGDARMAEQLVQLNDDATRLAFARFLARHGRATEALDHVRQVKTTIPVEAREDLIRSLIQIGAYPEAHEIWKTNNGETSAVKNASFEADLVLENSGFGWQAAKVDGISFALDVSQPHSGSRSLRISFEGYENQQQTIVSQLVLVKADHKYLLTFAVRTRDLVSGGLPVVSVSDAATGQVLATSDTIQPAAREWMNIAVEFRALSTSKAVSINLQRNKCSSSPCPIFGQVWLDSVIVDDARSD